MQNKQEPSRLVNNDKFLEVHSIFRTIQGEGPFTGRSAVFIRLAGCNLQCPFCDTDYTSENLLKSTEEIIGAVSKLFEHDIAAWADEDEHTAGPLNDRLIVITGGEPFRQNLTDLINGLLSTSAIIQVETNGTMNPRGVRLLSPNLYIVCSPKTRQIDPIIKEYAKAYKYVINHDSINEKIGLPVLALGHHNSSQHVALPDFSKPVYVQPADMQNEAENKLNLEACIRLVQKFNYILCLQTHKIINLP